MWLQGVCATSTGLVVYHHAIYPLALNLFSRMRSHRKRGAAVGQETISPSISLIIPAYNEARSIRAKIVNCIGLDYPDDRLSITIVCDGCTDGTDELARTAILELNVRGRAFEVVSHDVNRGKIAVLNETIASAKGEIIALSDVSALLSSNALRAGAERFCEDNVGLVSGAYHIGEADPAQKSYWRYQKAIKSAEARLGSPIGAHGAFYLFRRALWSPLEADTINDDVILPMRIVERGYAGVYDESIQIMEATRDNMGDDMSRRRRLAAGGVQQVARLWRLANPARPGLAFAFISGKGLRAFMPFLMLTAFLSSLALVGDNAIWTALATTQVLAYALGVWGMVSPIAAHMPGVAQLSYLVEGHCVGLVGATRYVLGYDGTAPWKRGDAPSDRGDAELFLNRGESFGKRALDIALASVALVALCVLFPFIALAIKLESRGPILYRQLRVGLRTPTFSRLFHLTKFRTMRADAEVASGAVWATEEDPRITRVGRFMRKTRLDELPQCIDVLRGDMSIVGPRPERPQFFNKLESAIPFYSERTYGLKPGITGLAQVTLPYDSSIEDVRAKVLHDHAYALRLSAPGRWLATDLSIIFRTFAVVILGKGR